jgi:hypothetical protein
MRAEGEPPAPARTLRDRLVFWCGLLLLVSSSAALEWSRLYRFEPRLPDHAGGALGVFGDAMGDAADGTGCYRWQRGGDVFARERKRLPHRHDDSDLHGDGYAQQQQQRDFHDHGDEH